MKKNIFLSAILGASLMLSGCGSVGTNGSATNSLLGSAAGLLSGTTGNTTTSVLTSAGTSVVGTLLSTLLGNTTSKTTIVGTWTYQQPKIAFESQNILAQIGSSVASSKLDSTLGTQLEKIGFKSGITSFTFSNDGTCQLTLGKRQLAGTYSYDSKTGVMTIQGALGLTTISPYVSVMGNELYMLFDADKLLSVMGAVSNVAKSNVLSSLLTSYNGLKLGWTMVRK